MYGEALNVGRAMFPQGDNKRFSEWVATAKLAIVHPKERQAAMWAASGNLPRVKWQTIQKYWPNLKSHSSIVVLFPSLTMEEN